MCLGGSQSFCCGHIVPTGAIIYCDRGPCKPKDFIGKKAWVNNWCQACQLRRQSGERPTQSASTSGSQTVQRSSSQVNHVNQGHPVLHSRREVSDLRRTATVNHGQNSKQPELNLRGGGGSSRQGRERPLPRPPNNSHRLAETGDILPYTGIDEYGTAKQQPPRQKATLIDIPSTGKQARKSSLESLLTPQAEAETFTANTDDIISRQSSLAHRILSGMPGSSRSQSVRVQRSPARKYSQKNRPRPSAPQIAIDGSASSKQKEFAQTSTGESGDRLAVSYATSANGVPTTTSNPSRAESSTDQPPPFHIDGGTVYRDSPGRTGTPEGYRPLQCFEPIRYGPSHTSDDFLRPPGDWMCFEEQSDTEVTNIPQRRDGLDGYANDRPLRAYNTLSPQETSRLAASDDKSSPSYQDELLMTAERLPEKRRRDKLPMRPQPVQILQRPESEALMTAEQLREKRERQAISNAWDRTGPRLRHELWDAENLPHVATGSVGTVRWVLEQSEMDKNEDLTRLGNRGGDGKPF